MRLRHKSAVAEHHHPLSMWSFQIQLLSGLETYVARLKVDFSLLKRHSNFAVFLRRSSANFKYSSISSFASLES